jgi:hypothetical protein
MFKQGLYWNFFPNKNREYLGFLRSPISKNKVYLNDNKPVLFYTGTGYIKDFKKFNLTNNDIDYLNKVGLDFYLYEPLSLKEKNKNHTNFYYSEFSHYNFDQIISEELESITDFSIKNNLTKITVYTCDYNINNIKKYYPRCNLFCYDTFIRLTFKVNEKIEKTKNTIEKKFFCSNWRYTAHRHLIMSYLSSKDGFYSWYFNTPFLEKSTDWLDISKFSEDINLNLTKGFDTLNKKKFFIDLDKEKTIIKNVNSMIWPEDVMPTPYTEEYLLCQKKSFCGIINETRFAYPFGNISEKTLSTINCRVPFILVGPPNSLSYLQNLGFKTFSKWWDESYDQETDHQKRISKIFNLIDFIDSMSLKDLTSMYNSMNEILSHNIKNLKKLSKDRSVF